jgi:hypothetical protein
MPDCGDQKICVAVVQASDGVAEADGSACGEAGCELEDAPFASGAWEASAVQGGGGGFPVDGGHGGADAGAVGDEPGGEVVAVQERAVGDEELGACFEWVEAGGAGAEGGGQVVSGHGGLRQR